QISIYGESFRFVSPVRFKFTDPVKGELYQPLVVVPPVVIIPSEDLKISFNEKESINGTVLIRGMKKGFSGKLTAMDAGTKKTADNVSFSVPDIQVNTRNQANDLSYKAVPPKTDQVIIVGAGNEKEGVYTLDRHEIKYDHIPWINYFHEAEVAIKKVDLKTFNKKVGYITGAGDKVPEALEQMGYEVTVLGDKELAKNNLDKFDAIITGVRAYNTNEWLNKYYDKLMKYVNEGGNLIVQYNTSNQIGPVRAKIGPYDFTITRNRVTDENAAVTFLKPEHPVFNFPNKITADDFRGWRQERSIYHGSDTSGKMEKLIAMADPGEKSDDGSLLVAKYGKGYFTYTGLVFFRELPAGVPGAYRLLANIIALNKKKGF
ncbi:MAG TPA: PIG-L family deacetylase, partial [Chitinophagaceae bacterium]|nr:PIG-L family deacetylase [Chitinophagaceae bacterium]